jgi:hypothetical protein
LLLLLEDGVLEKDNDIHINENTFFDKPFQRKVNGDMHSYMYFGTQLMSPTW